MWVSCSKLPIMSHEGGCGALQGEEKARLSPTWPWLHTVTQHIPEEENRMLRIQIKNNPRRNFLSFMAVLLEIECDLREALVFS